MRNSIPNPLYVFLSPELVSTEPRALSPELVSTELVEVSKCRSAEGSKDTINFFNMKTFLRKYRVLAIAFVIANLFLVSGAFGQATSTSRQTGNWNANATWSTTRTGTISTSGSSTTVTGSSTLFQTELSVGDSITTTADGFLGRVTAIASNTSLTIAAAATIADQPA